MSATPLLPCVGHACLDLPLVYGAAGARSVRQLLGEARALAALLPAHASMINLCQDRYRFAVAFLAALLRRQVNLLPASDAPGALSALHADFPDRYLLRDTPSVAEAGAPTFDYPATLSPSGSDEVPAFPAGQIAAVLFTSGSTGKPLAQPRRWGALVNSTRAAATALGLDAGPAVALLGTVPHQHSYGLESVIMLAQLQGHAFHDSHALLPADILARLAGLEVPGVLVTTPIHLRSLLAQPGELPPLHRVLCATAPLAPALAAQAEARFRAPLYEIYGCSEVGQIAVRRTTAGPHWHCLDGIVLTASGHEVRASGPAAANPALLNDVIELQADGTFLLGGRKSDLVNIAGKRSSLAFLNHQLNSIPGVQDGVFILPDGQGDFARLTAYVVAPGLSARQILAALKPQIDPAFLPRPLHLVTALPRNALGKLTTDALGTLP